MRKSWLKAGAAAVAVLAVTAAGCSRPTPEQEVKKGLASEPMFQALKEHYPTEYGQIKTVLVSRFEAGDRNLPQIIDQIRPTAQSLVQRQMRLADDQNAVAALGLIRDQTAKVLDRPEVCGPLLAGRVSADMNLPQVLGPELVKREMAFNAALLEQTAERPAEAVPGSYMAQNGAAAATAAMAALPQEEAAALQPVLASGVPPTSGPAAAAYCRFTHQLVTEIAKQPPAEAGKLFRSMAAAGMGG